MAKIALEIIVLIGIAAIYLLVLLVATIMAVSMCVKGYIDDIDYAMTANIIQFFVIMALVAEKVVQWMT